MLRASTLKISRSSAGFTLIELLVVMFIVGIIAAMATLSIGTATKGKGTEKELERIEDLLALASEEAVLRGREFGVTFYRREYEFSTYDVVEGSWIPLGRDSGPFNARAFPPDAIVDLEIEDRLIALAEKRPERKIESADKDEDKAKKKKKAEEDRRRAAVLGRKDDNVPQVFILSSGDITPFELRVRPEIGSPGISLVVADNGKMETVRDER